MTLRDHPLAGVRTRRTLKGISAPTIAQRIGITTDYYYKYERGERRIYLDKALAIARTLECSVEDLGSEPNIDEQVEIFRQRRLAEIAGTDTYDDEWERAIAKAMSDDDCVGEAAGTVVLQSDVNKTVHDAMPFDEEEFDDGEQ